MLALISKDLNTIRFVVQETKLPPGWRWVPQSSSHRREWELGAEWDQLSAAVLC